MRTKRLVEAPIWTIALWYHDGEFSYWTPYLPKSPYPSIQPAHGGPDDNGMAWVRVTLTRPIRPTDRPTAIGRRITRLAKKLAHCVPQRAEMRNLGWANGWTEIPPEVKRCRELGHQPSHVDQGPPNRGLEHVVSCDRCRYVYRYDSSD